MVSIKNLTKKYKTLTAIDNLSLDIEPGQIFGILGSNGAGKSTTVKAIVGSVIPTSGIVEVMSKNPSKDRSEVSKLIGYMPQNASLYTDLTALENIKFFADLHQVKNAKEKSIEVLHTLGLEERIHSTVGNFSGGMKTRVSLACTLVYEPEILLLDEPTAGLDPALKQKLWKMFQQIADSGRTVIITTHLMEEAMLCSQLAIIHNGKIVSKGTPQELLSKGSTRVEISRNDGTLITNTIRSDKTALAQYLHTLGINQDIETVEVIPESLEDILLEIIESK
ncbi:MAG: ABC transporter ATP-binding protein [Candidatus Dojkabacteria bacterium]